jgi:acetyltransferase EpsM
MRKLIIWGTGGHAKVVLDIVTTLNQFSDVIFIDDAFAAEGRDFRGFHVAGGRAEIPALKVCRYIEFIIAIGRNTTRANCFREALGEGLEPATIIHPSAVVSRSASIEPGTVVMPNVVINADAVIGADCIINTSAIVEHDCRIADHVHLSPGAALGGGVSIGEYSHIGLNVSVLPEMEIGERVIVGAGAVVVNQILSGQKVAGVPAKLLHGHAIACA